MKVPKHFPKWDKKIDALEDAGLWALDYERSRLPTDMVIPRTGQVWEAVRDCEVTFRANLPFPHPTVQPHLPKGFARFAPLSPPQVESYMRQFGTALLRRGERVRVCDIGEPKPINIVFVPLRYDELQESIVPPKVRALPGYHGYTLNVKAARTVSDFQTYAAKTYFNEVFRLVEDVPGLSASKH